MLSDVNECSYNRGGCEQLCVNFPGGYNCSCLQGYTLQSDDTSCKGIFNNIIKNVKMGKRVGMRTRTREMAIEILGEEGGITPI